MKHLLSTLALCVCLFQLSAQTEPTSTPKSGDFSLASELEWHGTSAIMQLNNNMYIVQNEGFTNGPPTMSGEGLAMRTG